jgi:hypothetical protein
MRMRGPVALSFVMGSLLMVQFFIPHQASQVFYRKMLDWLILIAIFMFFFALRSLVIFHMNRIKRKTKHWHYSYVTFAGLVGMAAIGVFGGIGQESIFHTLFSYLYVPMESTMFALLAFFIASAAFRAFRARTLEATLLLVTATIVMIGRVPIGGEAVHTEISNWVEWIMMYPNMAAQRGILIGVGFGMISTALKIVLGIERSYLGGGG